MIVFYLIYFTICFFFICSAMYKFFLRPGRVSFSYVRTRCANTACMRLVEALL